MVCYSNDTCWDPSPGPASQLFSSAIQFFAAAQCIINTVEIPNSYVCDNEIFDYIVVGAGTAGCVVANRLSEDKSKTVLLIEAGDDAPVETRIPGLDTSLHGSDYDWGYYTTKDGRCNQAHINESVSWPRGKVMGGSSNLNLMLYAKGVRADYDAWYRAGNKEWHADIVDYYFKKAESLQCMDMLKNTFVNQEYGHNGPLVINKFNSTNENLLENVIDSFDEMGIKRVADINLPGNFKSGILPVTAANGYRQSADVAYIFPIINRKNLKIIKNTLVTKVLLNKSKRAYGVEAEYNNGKMTKIYANLEVILSAGSINSPQLLMLSGIGPREHLKAKNIECNVNSPMVGQNLQDHPKIPVTIYGDGPCEPDAATKSFGTLQYIYNRTGYLAESTCSALSAFYSSSHLFSYPEYQNVLRVIWKNSSMTHNMVGNTMRLKEPIPTYVAELNKNHVLYLFEFNLLHPLSRGNISLNSNNPRDNPLIYPNYFLNPQDLQSAVMGINKLTKIVKTKFFNANNAFLGRLKWPSCDKYKLDSVDYWKCICMNMVSSLYHPVGTCKMGLNIETSVVDSRLRVHGVTNLRVIDASIMPTITSGNTNGPTTMIGERGADLVKLDHQC